MNLIKSVSIESLLSEYCYMKRTLEEAHKNFFTAKGHSKFLDIEKAAFGGERYRHNNFLYRNDKCFDVGLEKALNRLKAEAWGYLMNESGMKTFMGAEQIDKWEEQIREERCHSELPELTRENIEATFSALHSDKKAIFNQAVVNVFKGLSWEYKTNLPQKFGKRIIVSHIRNRKTTDRINDLEKAFCVLSGKEPKDYRQAFGTEIYQANFMQFIPDVFHSEFMEAKTFKKGTCHITFKDLDLVDKLNNIIAAAYPSCLSAPK